jgi:hypothetical protein
MSLVSFPLQSTSSNQILPAPLIKPENRASAPISDYDISQIRDSGEEAEALFYDKLLKCRV